MPFAITTVTVTLHGRAASDITTVEVDGSAVTIAPDRTWSTSIDVPGSGDRTVTITATGPGRIETRLVEVGAGTAPSGAG